MTGTPAGITLNGTVRPIREGETVTDLVEAWAGREIAADGNALDGTRLGIAVARNAEVVPRSRWASAALRPGDAVEILGAVQGG